MAYTTRIFEALGLSRGDLFRFYFRLFFRPFASTSHNSLFRFSHSLIYLFIRLFAYLVCFSFIHSHSFIHILSFTNLLIHKFTNYRNISIRLISRRNLHRCFHWHLVSDLRLFAQWDDQTLINDPHLVELVRRPLGDQPISDTGAQKIALAKLPLCWHPLHLMGWDLWPNSKSQKTGYVQPMVAQCWAIVTDGGLPIIGPTLTQRFTFAGMAHPS